MDFSADSGVVIAMFSNCTVTVGTDSVRGIYDAPNKQPALIGENLASTDPQVSLLQADVTALGVVHGTALTVTPDNAPDAPLAYLVKLPQPDGAGLCVCTLKLATNR